MSMNTLVPLVELTRGGYVECTHFGAIAVVNARGKVLAQAGDADFVTFTRSSESSQNDSLSTPIPATDSMMEANSWGVNPTISGEWTRFKSRPTRWEFDTLEFWKE